MTHGDPIGADWLAARAAASPRAPALAFHDATWTYAELDEQVDRLCALLIGRGLVEGDHVAALLPNSPAFVCLVHAAARLGFVMVPLNGRLTPSEMASQIDGSDARWLLADVSDGRADEVGLPPAAIIRLPSGRSDLAALLAAEPSRSTRRLTLREPGAIQAIVFTSGTSGRPKGAMITFANHFWSATASADRIGTHPSDCWLSCLPLYHVGGLSVLFRSCLYGTAVELHEIFDADRIALSLMQRRISLISLVPTMLHRLLERGGALWGAPLRVVLLGGAAAPDSLLARAAASGVPVALTYGLTEATSQVATATIEETRRKPGSVGRPLLFSRTDICDEDGNALPVGATGEIVISGPTVMAGYYGDEAATARALRHGRLHSGDLGRIDDDGDHWVLERRSDLIVSGGENVYPVEVENVLRSHPAVIDACVVGLPDAEWGQRVAAVITLQQPAETAEVLGFVRQRLAGYKLPRVLVVADSLPQTASGKIARRAVAEQLLAQEAS